MMGGLMDWTQAVEAMKRGEHVLRLSECGITEIAPDIRETGMEPCMLAHAWTADEKPAQVFMGSWSKVLFVPESIHREATDWTITTPGSLHAASEDRDD